MKDSFFAEGGHREKCVIKESALVHKRKEMAEKKILKG